MDMEQPDIEYEQEDYESAYNSAQPDTFSQLLFAPSNDKLVDVILKLKNDSDKFSSFALEIKEYANKKKDSVHLKKLESKILNLVVDLKHNDRYAETDQQVAILWFFEKICFNQKIMGISQKTEETFINIFRDFTQFGDFSTIIKLTTHINLINKSVNLSYPFSETLNYLYHEKYEKLQNKQISMKFVETMKTLNEEDKLIVKVGILNFFALESSRWKIQETQINKIVSVLSQKPYQNLFKYLIDRKFKSAKQLRLSILKAKLQIANEKAELIFGAKCELCKELKTQQNFETTAKNSGGTEIIPEFDSDLMILHGDYMYTKWSAQVLVSAKEKVSYDSTEEQLHEGFMKLLSFMKKLFEHRHKHIVPFGSQPKIVEESQKNEVPQETAQYICKFFQLFVRFMSFNSLEINHRTTNLPENIPVTFLDQLFTFFQASLKKYKSLSENQEKMDKKNKQDAKSPKSVIEETMDYVITFAAHLFYRRDFQSITALTSKTSQIVARILLQVESFPSKWNVLRNYKLVIDRWGDTVSDLNEDYIKMARKFLDSYFSDKVTVYSKSSSTVFNPMFASRQYCKIFGSQFLKCIQIFEKQLDEQESKNPQSGIWRNMNLRMSKMILFMSARLRFQEVNKIAEILARIYRKYAHVIPEIYLFRSWITQICLIKVPQQQISVKLAECIDILKKMNQTMTDLPGKKLLTSICKMSEQQNTQLIKFMNLYKTTHYRALNSLQLKSKTQQYGSGIYNMLWEITKEHIELEYLTKEKAKQFQQQNKQQYETLKQENDLLISQKAGSIQSIIHELKTNLLCLTRYFICNAEKMLTTKDHSALVSVIGVWIRDFVGKANQSRDRFDFNMRHLFVVFAFNLTPNSKNHFFKKQILGAMRALGGGEQFVMTRNNEIPFNEVSSLYEQIKPVYVAFVKLLLQNQVSNQSEEKKDQKSEEKQKQQKADKLIYRQILQNILLPNTNVFGPCSFNGKIQEKGNQDMALGLYLQQAQSIFKSFSVDQILSLQSQYPLSSMLDITKNKSSKITIQRAQRGPGRNIFAQNPRANRDRTQAMNELRQLNIPQEYIQIALENIDVPDPQLALEWIQNNQDRMETLIMEKVLRESKENLVMKPVLEPKLEVGKIAQIKYPQFIEKFQKAMKELVKNFAKQLFSLNGKKIGHVLFIILDAFKDDFRKKQYVNLCNKMFTQINSLHQKFDDHKYRLSLLILNLTMKKQPELFKEYYKEGICLKVLGFVGSFGKVLTNEQEKLKEQKEDFYQLLEIANKGLPEWKAPVGQVKPELVIYLDCLLNAIHLANLGGKDVWEILYKIASLQNKQLREKIAKLFSHIVIDKSILQEEKRHNAQDQDYNHRPKNSAGIFSKTLTKPLATKICMLPLAKILLEQDTQLLLANIELEIKGYIAQNYKYDIVEIVSGKEKNPVLQIDLKRFSNSFDKFVGCKEFEEVFRKLFTKKRSKKNSLFYDTFKHSFTESEFASSTNTSFICVKYSPLVEEIVKTMITRPVINQMDRERQQQALIELYKFLDYFKVLVPTALRTQWWSEVDQRNICLMEWLVCRSVAKNKKKFQFMTFLAMNNHMFVGDDGAVSDYVCYEYLKIFRREFTAFRQLVSSANESEQIFKQQSAQQQKFKKVFYNFLYLLQVDKFNAQCFLKVNQQKPIRQLLQDLFIHVNPTRMPIVYTLINQSIFILRKRQMIDLLKSKYQLVSHQQLTPIANNHLTQFLNMGLIYKVEPKPLDLNSMIKPRTVVRGNIYNGSNGRIMVDQMEDEEIVEGMDDMDEEDEYHESISHFLSRGLQQGSRVERVESTDQAYLYPLEVFGQNMQHQNRQQQPQQQPQQQQQDVEQNMAEKQNKIDEQPKVQPQMQKITKADYQNILNLRSTKLSQTLTAIQKLLPDTISLTHQSLSSQNIKVQQNIISQQQTTNKPQQKTFFNFQASLSQLISKAPKNTSQILPVNSKFEPNAQIKPQFICRLILNDGIEKLIKFQKRFKSLITTLSPQIKPTMWQNDYSTSSTAKRSIFQQDGREIPTARLLLQRLQRQNYGDNRDEILYHIERLLNQRRQQPRQQNLRPRTLNLTQAVQELPQQVQPPKVDQKLITEQKHQEDKMQEEQVKPENTVQHSENKVDDLPIEEKIVEQKVEEHKGQEVKSVVNEAERVSQVKGQKMEEEKPILNSQEKKQKKVQQAQSQMIPQQQPIQQVSQVQVPQQIVVEQLQIIQADQIQAPPQFNIHPMQQGPIHPMQQGPFHQILAMFGLPQTFLADNGIDPQSFDCLPEEFQIDQITHYMNQAQNRNAINQLNQANQQQPQQNSQQPVQNQEGAQQDQPPQQPPQPRNNVNDVLQQNIALFASMDPQTRMQMLADYPPEFLMQLPVQMRTEVEQYRQRQLHRFVQVDEEGMRGLREDHYILGGAKKNKPQKIRENAKYPAPTELQFNPISQSLAEHLSKGIFLKIQKSRVLEGFRLLLENYLTQQAAIATIVGILRQQDGFNLTQIEYNSQDKGKKPQEKKQGNDSAEEGYWKCESRFQSDSHEMGSVKESLLNLVLQTMNNSIYKNDDFLMKKVPYKNFLKLPIQPVKELQADQNGFWPLYELLPYGLDLCPKITVQILKRVKELPLKLIKDIVQAIRNDKLTTEIYKNLQFLSKNQDMKKLFMEEFPEGKPLKLQIFAKIIKYEFAKVPYLRKLHEEALNFYTAEYDEFLNQIFGIYSPEDIKEIESILMKHKHVHFQVIKYLYSQNRVLDKEPIGIILKMPHLLDFETKKYIFRNHPKIKKASRYRLPIEVSRGNILQQSYNQIMSKTPKQLQGKLQVTFMEEQGYDAGGLTREWLMCLSREIFRPDYALFEPSSSGNTHQPNPKSYVNPDHLLYFKFIGRFVGKALAEKELVNAYFTRAFYKMILGQDIELSDLEQQDYSFYKSMLWLKENPIEKGDYTFSYLYDNFGQRIVKDLIPDGRNVDVTEQNKTEYIEKYCLAKMRDDFKAQMQKFLEGFHEIIPHESISFFEAKELELLISGLPQINFEDLRKNVDYSGYAPTDQAIKWFWEIIEEFTQEDLAKLIQFITGTSKIPVDGFANIKGMNGPQRISIHKDPNSHQLPKAHTCFNQLDLPNYDSKEIMREKIVTAITWGSEGFGFM